MVRETRDIAASVRQRLLNLARNDGQAFDVVLVAFGLERLVYRLSISAYRNDFVLKGGMLVTRWTVDSGRFTRDIDFLAFGVEEEVTLRKMFSEILAIEAGDGLIYDTATLTAGTIREDHLDHLQEGGLWMMPLPRGIPPARVFPFNHSDPNGGFESSQIASSMISMP